MYFNKIITEAGVHNLEWSKDTLPSNQLSMAVPKEYFHRTMEPATGLYTTQRASAWVMREFLPT